MKRNGHRTRNLRWHSARRFRNAQLTLNCMEELAVIADYRRTEEVRLLRADSSDC